MIKITFVAGTVSFILTPCIECIFFRDNDIDMQVSSKIISFDYKNIDKVEYLSDIKASLRPMFSYLDKKIKEVK